MSPHPDGHRAVVDGSTAMLSRATHLEPSKKKQDRHERLFDLGSEGFTRREQEE